ncbi:helix-turn-helix domain-containing protein [Photobacterium angustum]|uniref:helix-turn-helix domain-containing protein n=1 Tax=Photobacterium angustum TaxID=661 RepID=UPI0005DF24BC|nr:helix-turn-helix transcriptional regulator [Photobacterium angustum]KJG00113.1 hypothetical protein UB35_19890 [Photobacterium angustum]PSV61674.1 XRE family transcriptional regulator [Photobacterium angustum]
MLTFFKKMRQEQGIRRDLAAKQLNIKKYRLGQIENGKESPTLEELKKISAWASKPLCEILDKEFDAVALRKYTKQRFGRRL